MSETAAPAAMPNSPIKAQAGFGFLCSLSVWFRAQGFQSFVCFYEL